MVLELLLPINQKNQSAHDPDSHFWKMAEKVEIGKSRFDKKSKVISLYQMYLIELCQ